MGKSSKPTIGYWYWMTEHFGVCYGPVDGIYEIKGGGRTAWTGEVTTSQAVRINASNLYGGEKKEGGVNGRLAIYMGEPDQAPPPELVGLLGAPQPAYRGLLTLVFDGIVGAMNPYIKPLSFRVGRWLKGWRTPVWEPDLCRIDKGMNPAHYIYRMYTDPVTGMGQDAAVLDLDRMREAAVILKNEGLGLVLKWTRRDVLNGMVNEICNHVGGEMSYDPRTGKQFLRLYRGGYDATALPLLDESNILELTSHEQSTIYGAVNSITMTYHNADTDKDESRTVTNPANIRAQGQTIDKPLNYPGLWSSALAIQVAMRELNAVSSLPARGKLKLPAPMLAVVNGQLQEIDLIKGDVVAFSWKELNLVRLPIRVLEIERGTWSDNAIIVSYTTDVNAMPTQSYVGDQPTQWVEPDTRPQPVPAQRLVEASYRDLAGTLRDADLAALSANSGHVGSLGVRASGVAYNYTLTTRVGDNGAFVEQGSGDFAPTGLLPAIVPASVEPIVAVLTSTRDLDQVAVGTEALIDDEVLRVDAIDATTGAVTLARGCGDTLPAAHNANARVWFTDFFTGADATEYLAGETIQAKLLTRTGQGELDEALAPIASLTLARRQARPYPPADLKVGGQRSVLQVIGPIDLSWSHRDRKAQRDQLVDATQPSIGPEPGTTYTVRTYLGSILVHTREGIAGASYSANLATNGPARVEVVSVRDGLSCMQVATTSFVYVAVLHVTGRAPSGRVGYAYSYRYTAAGGVAPYRWSIASGQLPAGLTLDVDTGRLSGTPTAESQASFVISVTDGSDQVVTLADTISIASSTASIGRYWRVLVLANNGDQYTSICKLRFLDVAGNSLTSPADADARASADSTANTQNPAANAFGTDLGKKWTAQPVAPPHWLQWDFGVSTPVYGIEIVGQYSGGDLADAAVRDFVLQVSDDAQRWTDVISVKGQTGWGAAEARRFNAARPALTPYEQAVLSQSPLVFIPCNDPEGSVASDISGYERHGAYPANAQLAAPSLFAGGARSVRLPGGALTIPYGAWQDLTGDFTLIIGASIAAPGADTGNYPKLIAKFVAASNGLATYLLQAQKSDGHLVGRVSTPSTSYNDVSTAVSVMDAQARLIVLRRAGNDLSLLVDNVKVSSVAVSGPVSVAPNGIQIGGSGTTDGIDASVMWFSLHAAALSDRVLTGLAQLTAPPQTGHRYWRVMVEATAGANVSLAQVEFLGARNAPIVALGGTPTASAALSGYGADKAFDGSGSGKWASGKSAPQWVQYDFGEGVKPDVQGVAITAPREGGADEAPAALRVQWSDDGDQWTDLVSTSGIASWSLGERRAFCKDGHRYWRLYVTKIGNMGQRYFALGAAGLLLQAGEAEDAAMTRGDKPYAASNPLQGASYVWHDTSGVGSNAFTFADGGMSTTGPWWLSVDLLAGTRFVPAELWLYAQPHTPDNTDRAPVDFVVQWSDDNQAWTDYKPFSGVSLPWTVGTAYRFSTTL